MEDILWTSGTLEYGLDVKGCYSISFFKVWVVVLGCVGEWPCLWEICPEVFRDEVSSCLQPASGWLGRRKCL